MFLSPAYQNYHLKRFISPDNYEQALKKSHVVPNGINDFWIDKRIIKNKNKDERTIIFVGSIIKRKNLATLIDTCELLNEQGFQINLYVVGDGPLLSSFKRKEFKTNIKYFGNISDRNKLRDIYNQADLLVVPSLMETFGLIYPEAMSQGLPVIYSKNEGFDGFYPYGHVGYSIDPKDSKDIADKIRMAYGNYNQLSFNASEAAKDFSWDVVAKSLLSIYTSISTENSTNMEN